MPSFTTVEIHGYQNRSIANTFVRQEDATDQIGIVFPGYGYRATMPVLYYPARLLTIHGADVLSVEYAYDQEPEWQRAPDAERSRWFRQDIGAAMDAALSQRDYRRITLVGKSMGTTAIGELLQCNDRLAGARCVWLTPLVRQQTLRDQIREARPPSLFVAGTRDMHYEPRLMEQLVEATNGEQLVIDGADHSLEIPGDLTASVQAMARVVHRLDAFLRQSV